MGAFSRIDLALQYPVEEKLDFNLLTEVIREKIICFLCNVDYKKTPSDFDLLSLEQLREIYKNFTLKMEVYRSVNLEQSNTMDKENISNETKKKITKEEMMTFIYLYDTSISLAFLNTLSSEAINELYQKFKEERKKRIDKEFKRNKTLKKRRGYEYEREEDEE